MKMEHVPLIVSVFHLRVGADVNTLDFHLRRLNRGCVDKISRLLRRYSKSPERRSDIGSKSVGKRAAWSRFEEINGIYRQPYLRADRPAAG